ncbi:MAG TPA: M1 family aminopeptidase [Thermoanaerobaculia bacterium]|nr:M1 family aminopeptidase [Thermoanaerobaculia bacterium]
MLREIVRFEWRYHSRQPAFIAASLLFFLLGFALSVTQFGPDNVAVNSPYLVMEGFGLLSLVALIVAGIFAANAVLRDDDHRMSEIVHTTPVGKLRYLLGRFGGAFLATLTTVLLSALGMAVGALMPWLPPERLAAMDARPYLAAFGVITLPNVLLVTVLLFAVAVLTRNAIATYAAAVVLYVLYFVSAALTDSPLMAGSKPGGGGGILPSLLDPFALTSLFDVTRYWTAAEKNARFIPFAGVLLGNRLIWIAAALGILTVVYRGFSFRMRKVSVPVRDRRAGSLQESPGASRPWSPIRPAGTSWLAAYRSRTELEIRTFLTKSALFLLLLWLGWAVSEIYGGILTGEYNSTSYPVTSLVLAALQTPATILGTILILYYGAELFWREQRFRMASIVDSTPVSGTAMIAAKWTALAVLIGAMLLGGALAGVALQVAKGWPDFQPFLYLSFFYFTGAPLLLYAAAALFIHALSPGKYAGMIFFLLFMIVSRRAAAIGLEHDLWRFANPPSVPYTELNGFGHYAAPFHGFMLHWLVLALFLSTLTSALWRRIGAPLRERLRLLARRNRPARALAAMFAVTGGWIFYNTNVVRDYVTAAEISDWKADYEKAYKRIEKLPHPRILAVDGEVDLYPAEQRYRVAGRYALVNESAQPIPSVYVARRREARRASLSIPSARLAVKDDRFGVARFDFQPPLAPGAHAQLRFDLSFDAGGFASGQQDDAVVENGTFLMNLRAFPTLGYRESYELSDLRERRKRGLSGASTAVLAENGAHGAVDPSTDEWIDLRMTVSTAGDQIALAPGRLERSWRRGGRRWFRYRTEAPILNRFAVSSGRYAVAKRRHGPVDIELYYHPPHAANVAHMLDTAAASLDVMQSSFGSYPHHQLRIVELSSYWPMTGYALPGTIYLREDGGFLTDARDPNRPDLIARRVAHEVSHQWFGHRVNAANVEGASIIVESLAKYSELRVVERMRGREQVRQLLAIELDRYLSGRAGATYPEVPLYKADNQGYLFYSKAAVVLFAIRDLLGQEAMERAIRAMMQERHPTSVDLVRHLQAVADAAQRALIEQWMKEIVLYDLRVAAAQAHRRADGRYDVIVRVEAGKSRADGRGREQTLAFGEPIEIAVAADSRVLDSRKHLLRRGTNEIKLVVAAQPSSVTVDPEITRIDRNPVDNGMQLSAR